jgi:hypothetical protein
VLNQRILKDKHLKLKLQKGGQRFDAIRFNCADELTNVPDRIRAAFRVDINEWNGTQTVQLLLEHFELNPRWTQPCAGPHPRVPADSSPAPTSDPRTV